MFNPNSTNTRFYFDGTFKEKDHDGFDDLWRTCIAYYVYGDEELYYSILKCIPLGYDNKIRIVRTPGDSGSTTSRDLVAVLLSVLLLTGHKELAAMIAKDIGLKISDRYWCLPSFYFWVKYVAYNKAILKYLFYFFLGLQLTVLLPWTLLILKIYKVTPEDWELHTDGRYDNKLQYQPKIKKWFLSKTFQSFALLFYTFQLHSIKADNWITKILLKYTIKRNPTNYLVRKFLNDDLDISDIDFPATNDFYFQRHFDLTTDVAIWQLHGEEAEFNNISRDIMFKI